MKKLLIQQNLLGWSFWCLNRTSNNFLLYFPLAVEELCLNLLSNKICHVEIWHRKVKCAVSSCSLKSGTSWKKLLIIRKLTFRNFSQLALTANYQSCTLKILFVKSIYSVMLISWKFCEKKVVRVRFQNECKVFFKMQSFLAPSKSYLFKHGMNSR